MVSSYVIHVYESEFITGIVTSNIDKEMDISTLVRRSPKNWRRTERCSKIVYELDKMKEVITLPELINSKNIYSVPEG